MHRCVHALPRTRPHSSTSTVPRPPSPVSRFTAETLTPITNQRSRTISTGAAYARFRITVSILIDMNILVTGATGNIGREVIRQFDSASDHKIFAAIQKTQKNPFPEHIEVRTFDFCDHESVGAALKGIDVVFLLRPPQIAAVKKIFKPLIELCKSNGVHQVVFLSVQGVENQIFIPHYKIEKLLYKSGIRYTFIRPGYFMQNLTTTLRKDIERGEIYLPSGRAKFNWVDAADIGLAIATVLKASRHHINKAYVITGREQLAFKEVAEMISRVTGKLVHFKSPALFAFFLQKRREGERISMIFVLMLLHCLPRLSKPLPLSGDFSALTGCQPGTLEEFMKREMMRL